MGKGEFQLFFQSVGRTSLLHCHPKACLLSTVALTHAQAACNKKVATPLDRPEEQLGTQYCCGRKESDTGLQRCLRLRIVQFVRSQHRAETTKKERRTYRANSHGAANGSVHLNFSNEEKTVLQRQKVQLIH